MKYPDYFLTVIIPVLNPDPLLFHQCLQSLLNIAVPSEIIVINDGSDSPHSEAIAEGISAIRLMKSYGPKRSSSYIKAKGYRYPRDLRLIRQEHAGVSFVRNRGIQESRGRFIFFLDSDDAVLAEYCTYLNRHWKDISGEWILSPTVLYDLETEKSRVTDPFHEGENAANISSGERICPSLETETLEYSSVLRTAVMTSALNACWGKLIRRDLLLRHPDIRFPEGMLSSEDRLFNIRLLRHVQEIRRIPVPGCRHNIPSASAERARHAARVLTDPWLRQRQIARQTEETRALIEARYSPSVPENTGNPDGTSTTTDRDLLLRRNRAGKVLVLARDCRVLCEAGRFDRQSACRCSRYIRQNHLTKGLGLSDFFGIREKCCYLLVRFRAWGLLRLSTRVTRCRRVRKLLRFFTGKKGSL